MKNHKLHITVFYAVGAFSLALSLSLDTLPRHIKVQTPNRLSASTHRLHDSDLDFENNFIHNKRTPPAISGISHSPSRSELYSYNEHKRTLYEDGYPRLHSFRDHTKIKRKADEDISSKSKEEVGREEIANILKDDESDKTVLRRERKIPPDTKRQESIKKKKRESQESPAPKENKPEENEKKHEDFQEWLQKEYYRNMARNFASMRRKRAMWGPMESDARIDSDEDEEQNERRRMLNKFRHESIPLAPKKEKENRFDEVTSNLKAIEDALLADALDVVKGSTNNYEDDYYRRQRVSNDLNAAYDIETMRSALFRLRDTLYSIEEEMSSPEEQALDDYIKHRKRSDGQCAPLNVLTSDCSVLGDIVPDDSLKDLLTHACNWHEVCYSCGEVFGLSSDNCDMGFVEQSRTICRGDVPCESTARLLLLPLRQRRVFYKRSNPSVCLVDPCVEEFLTKA